MEKLRFTSLRFSVSRILPLYFPLSACDIQITLKRRKEEYFWCSHKKSHAMPGIGCLCSSCSCFHKTAVESLASWESSFPKNSGMQPKSNQRQHSLDFCHVSAMLVRLLTKISFLPDFKTGLPKNSYYRAARIWIKLIDLNLGGPSVGFAGKVLPVKFHLVLKRIQNLEKVKNHSQSESGKSGKKCKDCQSTTSQLAPDYFFFLVKFLYFYVCPCA